MRNNMKNKKTNIKMTQEFCHSFWRSECENKNVECYRCSYFYSEPLEKYRKECERINKRNEKRSK